MTITNITIVSFHIPDEFLDAMKFEQQNDMSKWMLERTSGWFIYKRDETYFSGGKKEA